MTPVVVNPVKPLATPAAVMSQIFESKVMLSPLSPRVTTPLASRVVATATEPVKLAALEIVWSLMRPEVMVLAPIDKAPPNVRLESVPTEVKEELSTVALRVAPLRVPAGAITVAVDAAVIKPLALTVKVGMAVDEPNEPTLALTVARVVPFPTEVTSPIKLALVVTLPAVRPEAVPVMLVPTRVEGVPRSGVTRVGEFENTKLLVPVSSVTVEARLALDGVCKKSLMPVAILEKILPRKLKVPVTVRLVEVALVVVPALATKPSVKVTLPLAVSA